MSNPFAPPTAKPELPTTQIDQLETVRRSWLGSIGLWTLVCVVSAAPSFAWGLGTIAQGQIGAMLLGVFIFIVGYVLADQGTQGMAWRRDPPVRLTLKIGYIARLVVSIIFPIGGVMDMFCGFFSWQIVSFVYQVNGADRFEGEGFLGTLLITLVQGIVLNIILGGFMLMLLGILLITRQVGR